MSIPDTDLPPLPEPYYGPDTTVDEDSDGAFTTDQLREAQRQAIAHYLKKHEGKAAGEVVMAQCQYATVEWRAPTSAKGGGDPKNSYSWPIRGDKVFLAPQPQAIEAAVVAERDAELARLLPCAYYMDPPDGGSVTVMQQLERMAEDAARYRWLRNSKIQDDDQEWLCVGLFDDCGVSEVDGAELDAKIDAAIAAQRGENG